MSKMTLTAMCLTAELQTHCLKSSRDAGKVHNDPSQAGPGKPQSNSDMCTVARLPAAEQIYAPTAIYEPRIKYATLATGRQQLTKMRPVSFVARWGSSSRMSLMGTPSLYFCSIVQELVSIRPRLCLSQRMPSLTEDSRSLAEVK